jgi:hypothetical protein
MNAIYESRSFKYLTCAVGALLISAVLGWGFWDGAAHALGLRDGVHPATIASVRIPLKHEVFGRPEPAVLVD